MNTKGVGIVVMLAVGISFTGVVLSEVIVSEVEMVIVNGTHQLIDCAVSNSFDQMISDFERLNTCDNKTIFHDVLQDKQGVIKNKWIVTLDMENSKVFLFIKYNIITHTFSQLYHENGLKNLKKFDTTNIHLSTVQNTDCNRDVMRLVLVSAAAHTMRANHIPKMVIKVVPFFDFLFSESLKYTLDETTYFVLSHQSQNDYARQMACKLRYIGDQLDQQVRSLLWVYRRWITDCFK